MVPTSRSCRAVATRTRRAAYVASVTNIDVGGWHWKEVDAHAIMPRLDPVFLLHESLGSICPTLDRAYVRFKAWVDRRSNSERSALRSRGLANVLNASQPRSGS